LTFLTGGVLSHGSVYLWYPLLGDLQQQSMHPGLIAAFRTSRAIKLPLMPLLIYYFGWSCMLILFVYILIAACVEGLLLDHVRKNSVAPDTPHHK
jgi:hypothetical protein